jgi:tetratricopeptide (TPR) repeat protein
MHTATPERIGRCLVNLLRLIELERKLGYMYAAELFRDQGASWLALRLYRDSATHGYLQEWTNVGEILVEQRLGQRALNAFEWCDNIQTRDRDYQKLQEHARQLVGQAPNPRHLTWSFMLPLVRNQQVREAAASLGSAPPMERALALIPLLESADDAVSADATSLALAALDTWAFEQLIHSDWPPPYSPPPPPPPDYSGQHEWNEALTLLGEGQPRRALTKIDEAIALSPERPIFHHDRGIILRKLGRKPEALEAWTRTLELDVAYEDAYVNASTLLMQEGREREAINLLNRAIAMSPGVADLYFNRACAHARLRDKSSLLADLEECFNLDPDQTVDVELDDDFAHYRDDEDFQMLMAEFEELR